MDNEVAELSKLEHDADEIKRMIELEYYYGAFLPFDREDRAALTELVDSVSDMAEETAYSICLSRLNYPKKRTEGFRTVCKCDL